MNISKNISNKLDKNIVEVLLDLTEVTASSGIAFLVVGAVARDIMFSALYDIPTTRASLDVDLGVRINTWTDFERIIEQLVAKKSYVRDAKQAQRLKRGEILIDIVPFGNIERPAGSIAWPPDYDIVMKTVGFQEAFIHAVDVKISTDPDVTVKVSTPPALAIMKLNSWKDNYPSRTKDAIDLLYLLKTYIRAGNESRLFSSDADLVAEQLEPDQESARLLGRDAQMLCTAETKRLMAGILEEELAEGSSLRLLSDMMSVSLRDDSTAEKIFQLLKQFNTGLLEEIGRKDANFQ